jgi:hypothetical protein
MNRHEIEKVLIQLSHSQGSYGRLLRDISNMSDHEREEFWASLEQKGFKDAIDVVMHFES